MHKKKHLEVKVEGAAAAATQSKGQLGQASQVATIVVHLHLRGVPSVCVLAGLVPLSKLLESFGFAQHLKEPPQPPSTPFPALALAHHTGIP